MNESIAILGWHEGLAGQLHALLEAEGYSIVCFINDYDELPDLKHKPPRPTVFNYPDNKTYKGLPILPRNKWIENAKEKGVTTIILAASDNNIRKVFLAESQGNFIIKTYIHASAQLLPGAVIDEGVIILANVIVGYNTHICSGVILNNGAQIDHNSKVQICASIMPSATICGSVDVGNCASIGAGAVIINNKKLGEQCYVGAGAVVLNDVPDKAVVVGVPAKILRYVE